MPLTSHQLKEQIAETPEPIQTLIHDSVFQEPSSGQNLY